MNIFLIKGFLERLSMLFDTLENKKNKHLL